MGHIARCLALAEAMEARQHSCVFRLPDTGGVALVRDAGFPYKVLGADDWRLPGDAAVDLFVIDHYAVTAEYFRTFSAQAPVVYIDDLCMERYPVSAILNGHIYAEELPYRKLYQEELLLLGTEFSLLRSSYTNRADKIFYPITAILVTTGGTDPDRIMGPLLGEVLQATATTGIEIHAVIGSGFEESEQLLLQFGREPRIIIHEGPVTLAPIMEQCQLAISAAGTTFYELAALGIPALTWQMVDNQRYVFRSVTDKGLAKDFNPQVPGDLTHVLSEAINDSVWVLNTSKRLRALVDGWGASRAADALVQYLTHPEGIK